MAAANIGWVQELENLGTSHHAQAWRNFDTISYFRQGAQNGITGENNCQYTNLLSWNSAVDPTIHIDQSPPRRPNTDYHHPRRDWMLKCECRRE
jgi:hypothetical protein